MPGKTIDQLTLGQSASFTKTVSESDVYLFAGVTGDFNPAHVDETWAAKTAFKTRIAHGMLSAGFISNVLGNQLPGPGTIYIQQVLNFRAKVAIGDTITATAEVIEINKEKKRVRLRTVCTNQEGTVVLDGEALVSPPRPG
jgi:3-hydroxybutyryl-CoA dehydratase